VSESYNRGQIRRRGAARNGAKRGAAAAALYLMGLSFGEARAQGLFEILFRSHENPAAPSQALSYARPDSPSTKPAAPVKKPLASLASASGPAAAGHYCVRLCDGRFFPIVHQSAASAAQLCQAFCPASQTKIFSGPGINHARTADGTRYRNLPTAFVYRAKLLPDCNCNGRDHFGLAQIDPRSDPTTRPAADIALAKAYP